MSFHECRRFTRRGIACPAADIDEPGRRHRTVPPGSREGLQDLDENEEAYQTRLQEEISAYGRRVAARESTARALNFASLPVAALSQLQRQGMVGVPTLANGGLAWAMQILSRPEIVRLLEPLHSGQPVSTLDRTLGTVEEQYAQGLAQDSTRSSPKGIGLTRWIAALIEAVAFAGAIGAAAAAGRGQRPSAPRRGSMTGRGAGGLTFQAPTFRPGFQKRLDDAPGFSFQGGTPTD